jgi:hypothetical protein
MRPRRRRLSALLAAAATALGLASLAHPAAALAATTGTNATTVQLHSRSNPSAADQHLVLDAAVDTPAGMPFATGTLTFEDSGSPLITVPLDGEALASVSVVLDSTGPYQHPLTAVYSGDADFAPSTSAELVEDVVGGWSPNERFVHQLYNDILNRMADTGFLISELDWGHINRQQAAGALAYSREYVTHVVNSTYEQYLGRTADPQGLSYWVTRIMSGLSGTIYPGMPPLATDESLALSFLTSPEYVANAGGNDGLVLALYNDILGRDPDAGGHSYWTGRLTTGTPPAQLASLLLYSNESMQNRVTAAYLSILWRDPDPQGLAYWTSRLQQGARDEDLITLLAGSDEYWQRTQAL